VPVVAGRKGSPTMGQRKAWALAWLLAATLSVLLLQAPSARGDELLVNGGFEDGVARWVVRGGTLQSVDGLGRAGSAAGVFSVDAVHSHRVSQCVPAFGEVDYQFSGWVTWPGEEQAPSAYLRVSWYGQADCFGDEVDSLYDSATVPLVNAGHWYHLTLDTKALVTTARSARVSMFVLGDTTVYLDDFSFSGPAAPSPTPSPTPPQTQTPLPTASPSPSPRPIASPTPTPVASPSPTVVPTATEVPSTPTPTRAPAAVLANAGFEEADAEGRPLDWQKYGGELRRSAVAKQEGWFAAAFTSRTTSTKWAFQTVSVEGGEAYILGGYALKNDANVQGAYLRLSWYASPDGSGKAIDSVDSTIRLTDDSPDFRFLTTGPVEAPSEAASAKVRLMLDPVSEVEGKVYFDDISFEETVMPPPTQTAVPSPPFAATQTPLALPSDAPQDLPLPAVAPMPPAEEAPPPSSPTVLPPSPTVLGATLGDSETVASSRDGFSQSEAEPEETPSRTPVVLYRERSSAQSARAERGVAAAAGEGDGLWLSTLVLATAAPAATAAAAAFFVWRRLKKRARPL
jgi:hypothetical protein